MCSVFAFNFSYFNTILFPNTDRVVDDLNPVLTFTRREVESLLHFVEEEPDPSEVQLKPADNTESVLQKALHHYSHLITKVHQTKRLVFTTRKGGNVLNWRLDRLTEIVFLG